MKPPSVSSEMLLQVRREREAIASELSSLELQDARLAAASAEDTLSGHLRRAIHASNKPLYAIADDASISRAALRDFLEGLHSLQSDELDRLTAAAGVTVTLAVTSR